MISTIQQTIESKISLPDTDAIQLRLNQKFN